MKDRDPSCKKSSTWENVIPFNVLLLCQMNLVRSSLLNMSPRDINFSFTVRYHNLEVLVGP